MELIFTILKYIGLGFLAFVGIFILIVIVFGKRIEKQWAVRADFKGPGSRNPVGRFVVEKIRIEGEGPEFRPRLTCKLRHVMLQAGQRVKVTVGEATVMEGEVQRNGRLWLRGGAWTGSTDILQPGGRVTVWVGSEALVTGELYSDFNPAASTVKDSNSDAGLPRTAKIVRKSTARPLGFALVALGLIVGYFAWREGVSPVVLGFIGFFPLAGFYLMASNTTNVLYIDNGRLGWYSRFNRQLHADQVPIEQIRSLKVKPYRFGRRGHHYQAVIGLVDGYEIPLPDNLLGGNITRYVEKQLLGELRRFRPSIEYILEEPVQGRPVNRIRLPLDR